MSRNYATGLLVKSKMDVYDQPGMSKGMKIWMITLIVLATVGLIFSFFI